MIVDIEPKRTRQSLGGYLAHSIVAQGEYRYLHIAIQIAGAERRLVSLLAPEPQHAVEVAHALDARDAERLERLFGRFAIKFGCGGSTWFETQAAKDAASSASSERSSPRRHPVLQRPRPGAASLGLFRERPITDVPLPSACRRRVPVGSVPSNEEMATARG